MLLLRKNKIRLRTKQKVLLILIAGICTYVLIPVQLFNDPYATIINDANGELLSAKIADDGQWRFPEVDSVPQQLKDAIVLFEDEYFYFHPGVNPVSLFRAFRQNINAGRVISGGSTLTMQVVRLLRKNKPRTYAEKCIELLLAFKLSVQYSKEEIIQLYVSHAPYGGNVVGVEAASWRYFNRPLHLLSTAEYATLAVLPNAPSLIHPGKNSNALLTKRNGLLKKMYKHELFDSVSYSLSLMEPVPQKPKPLPNDAFHLLDFAVNQHKKGQRISSTVEKHLQKTVAHTLDVYVKLLSQNEIRNACAMVISLDNMEVKAYVGNTRNKSSGARYVDIIQAARSSGSILKPFLYGKAMDAGIIHSSTLLRDVPVSIDKFTPTNFDKDFEGVVPAWKALSKSLNIPATLLLRDYGIVPFYEDLQHLGFSTIHRPAGNYGLTLILGGAEVSLWDLGRIYAHQAKRLLECNKDSSLVKGVRVFDSEQFTIPLGDITEGGWWLVSEALTNVQRPHLDENWRLFSSSRKIAWKTGTSHGFRDAWAVGYDAGYVVAVWVGNAEGDGRPGLTGVSTAAPLMFRIFQHLPVSHWFEKPEISLKHIKLCKTSGLLPGPYCPVVTVNMPLHAIMEQSCTLHKNIQLNADGLRVTQNCEQGTITDTVWFSLDPVAVYYYKRTHQQYRVIPPYKAGCGQNSDNMLAIIYPHKHAEIIVPKDLDGVYEKILLEAAHTNPMETLYWHIDNEFVGFTKGKHSLLIELNAGVHSLLILDEEGNSSVVPFKVYKD